MTSHETAIAERLRAAADRIEVDADASRVTEAGPTTDVGPPPVRRRRVLAGMAMAASVAAVVAAVRLVPDDGTVRTGPPDTAAAAPVGDPSAPSYAAHVASPPDWFGEPRGGFSDFGLRTGRWVSMAIGRESADRDRRADPDLGLRRAGTGCWTARTSVTIDGTPRRSVRLGEWQALATDGTPTVVVGGAVDERTLAAVLDAVEVTDPSGDFSLRLRSRPEGYSEVVSPRVLGPDQPMRPALAGSIRPTTGSTTCPTGPTHGWPRWEAAQTSAAVDVDGGTGWTGVAHGNASGPLRFLVWSPRPGCGVRDHDRRHAAIGGRPRRPRPCHLGDRRRRVGTHLRGMIADVGRRWRRDDFGRVVASDVHG